MSDPNESEETKDSVRARAYASARMFLFLVNLGKQNTRSCRAEVNRIYDRLFVSMHRMHGQTEWHGMVPAWPSRPKRWNTPRLKPYPSFHVFIETKAEFSLFSLRQKEKRRRGGRGEIAQIELRLDRLVGPLPQATIQRTFQFGNEWKKTMHLSPCRSLSKWMCTSSAARSRGCTKYTAGYALHTGDDKKVCILQYSKFIFCGRKCFGETWSVPLEMEIKFRFCFVLIACAALALAELDAVYSFTIGYKLQFAFLNWVEK